MWRCVLLVAGIFISSLVLVYGCNEAVCASVVSKCMLTQSCKCDLKNCSCCKDCFNCLGILYTECCSCVEMCPTLNNTGSELKKSHVHDFPEPVISLFEALTVEPDIEERWTAFTFPIDIDISMLSNSMPKDMVLLHSEKKEQDVISQKNIVTVNCTVAYMSQCLPWKKCETTCGTMGASSYRWFHDGCCECVGHSCINYGINNSRCQECPPPDDDDKSLELDYGYETEDS